MRLRTLTVWLALPPLLAMVLAAGFVWRAIDAERDKAEHLGVVMADAKVLEDSYVWISAEITNLLALDAFSAPHPDLDNYRASARALVGTQPQFLANGLRHADRQGAATLNGFVGDHDLPRSVEYVLRPLEPHIVERLAEGEKGLIDPAPYGDAARWVMTQTADTQKPADAALEELQRFSQRGAPWQTPWFLGLVLTVALAGAVGTALALWRVRAAVQALSGRIGTSEAKAATLAAQTERYRHLIELGRNLTALTDVQTLSHTLVEETRRLLGGDIVSLVRREDATVRPVVVAGTLPVATIASGQGVVGRTVDAGVGTRTVVSSDPFVPVGNGPLALLTAPLVIDGQVIGALVVGSRSTATFDENDETALQLLAFLAAGALAAAQRFDSTVALTLSDPLTGLGNRRKLDLDLAKCAVTESTVGFLMVDIDHFKDYNDRHGHQRGDALLRTVASAISSAVRQGDVVYRYGGEEFSVLLLGADAATAAAVAERIRHAVRNATAHLGPDSVTVSVGVATQSAPLIDATLLDHADAALYAAKGTGRDRVMMHGSSFT